jgi:flagellar motor switch protein FliM
MQCLLSDETEEMGMPQEALSQDAIDRLLREMASGSTPASQEEQQEEAPPPGRRSLKSASVGAANTNAASLKLREPSVPRRIRDYDFRRPNRISKEYMRGLRMIHENFAREAPRQWGPLLRAGGQFKILSMEQTIYEEYRNHLSPHCFICTVALSPLEGEMAFQMESESAFVVIDRILGGPGTGLAHTRELTPLELAMLQRMITSILPIWREAWLPIIHLEPVIARTLSSIEFLQLTAVNESVLVTTFQARFLNTDIEVTTCIPYALIAPILSRINVSEHFSGVTGSDEMDRERLLRRMRGVSLAVAARLGTAPVPISELAQLGIGDVIRLDIPVEGGQAQLHIGDHAYFTVRPGLVNGNMAVQVTGITPSDT